MSVAANSFLLGSRKVEVVVGGVGGAGGGAGAGVDRRPQWLSGGIGQCSRSRVCRVEAALAQVVLGDAFGDGRVELVKLLQKLLHLLEDEERGVARERRNRKASVRLHGSARSSKLTREMQ
jgi:hypothetical protein